VEGGDRGDGGGVSPAQGVRTMLPRKLALPTFLAGHVDQAAYERWVTRKADAHVKRDRKRGHSLATKARYREAIHLAVLESDGRDVYTGEQLDWRLIGRYNNEHSKLGRHKYKAEFALLPTVDHIEAASTEATFCICSWPTNDAKNDLTRSAFLKLCLLVARQAGHIVAGAEAELPLVRSSRPISSEDVKALEDEP
jgi:hypothetical protein